MPLPEIVVPALGIAGSTALVFVILRCFPSVTRAVVTLVAGLAAVLSKDKERREAGIKVLDVLGNPAKSELAKPPSDAED